MQRAVRSPRARPDRPRGRRAGLRNDRDGHQAGPGQRCGRADRGRRDGHLRVCGALARHGGAGDRPDAVPACDLPGRRRGRIHLPDRRRRAAVPAAAPDAARLRDDAVPIRPRHPVDGGRRHDDEIGGAAHPAPGRIPQRADLERARRRRHAGRLRGLHPRDAGARHDRRAAGRRFLPLAAVHQRQRHRVRGSRAGAA